MTIVETPPEGPCVDGPALCSLLQGAGLFAPDLAREAADLSARYPQIAGQNLFAEFEMGADAVPSGFGLGLPFGLWAHWLFTDHWFLSSPAGRDVTQALAADPFAEDNRRYINIVSDDDPDWIEYDVEDGRMDPVPFVFFRPPSRLRSLETVLQAHEACALLPDAPGSDFQALLETLLKEGPVSLYRIGVAERRGRGWWRAILTDLTRAQAAAGAEAFGAHGFEPILDLSEQLYAAADTPGARFALSVDVKDGRITAIDVECAYLFRIGDLAVRSAAFTAFLARAAAQGVLPAQTAEWLGLNGVRELADPDTGVVMKVRLHHLKHRLVGAPRLRTKAYLHLELEEAR